MSFLNLGSDEDRAHRQLEDSAYEIGGLHAQIREYEELLAVAKFAMSTMMSALDVDGLFVPIDGVEHVLGRKVRRNTSSYSIKLLDHTVQITANHPPKANRG